MDRQKDEFLISDDPGRLDVGRIHGWLSEESYWAKGIPRKTVEAAIAGAMCFGIYVEGEANRPGLVGAGGDGDAVAGAGAGRGAAAGTQGEPGLVDEPAAAVKLQGVPSLQVGFARVITDRATFAYLADVFVDSEYRGRGLSKWLMEVIISHPGLQGLRNWMLQTQDAQGLYAQFGFKQHPYPERVMTRADPDVYKR